MVVGVIVRMVVVRMRMFVVRVRVIMLVCLMLCVGVFVIVGVRVAGLVQMLRFGLMGMGGALQFNLLLRMQ